MFNIMRVYILMLVFIILLRLPLPAYASKPICRKYHHQKICIINIKRSAKNYWEYRAEISINDKLQSLEIYNCRNQTKEQIDGTTVPFTHENAGLFVCSFFHNSK